MTVYDVFVNADGKVQCVYDDALQPLFRSEDVQVRRASHVEPVRVLDEWAEPVVRWAADLRPVNGPILMGRDGRGYLTREEALAAERAWLEVELMAGPLMVGG